MAFAEQVEVPGQAPSFREKCFVSNSILWKKRKKNKKQTKKKKIAKHTAWVSNTRPLGAPLVEAGKPTESQPWGPRMEPGSAWTGHQGHQRFSKCKKIHCFVGLRPILDPRWLPWTRLDRGIYQGY